MENKLMNCFDWDTATDSERAAYKAGYYAGAENKNGEAALRRIASRLGMTGYFYNDVSEHAIKRLDGCEEIIDKLRSMNARKQLKSEAKAK